MRMRSVTLIEGDPAASHSGWIPGLNAAQEKTDDDQFPSDLRSEINDILTGLGDGFNDILR
jgi:hypothetical protein